MHIQDGFLDVPTCIGTAAMSAAAVAWSMRRVKQEFAERTAPLMGVVAACVFAAQMLNFPIPGATSGHLLGGVLAAVMLGPWSGVLVLTVVLLVQAVLFGDGGITALGANIFNVGVMGSLVGYAVFAPLRRWIGGTAGTVAGSVVAAWFSVVLGAAACSVQLSFSQSLPLWPVLGAMLLFHTMIGLGESLITGVAVSLVLQTRPDLVYGHSREAGTVARTGQIVVAGLAVAFAMAVLLSPFASGNLDGLERALEDLKAEQGESGIAVKALQRLVPMTDYAMPGFDNIVLAGSVAGALGTLAVFAVAFVFARSLRANPPPLAHPSHAS